MSADGDDEGAEGADGRRLGGRAEAAPDTAEDRHYQHQHEPYLAEGSEALLPAGLLPGGSGERVDTGDDDHRPAEQHGYHDTRHQSREEELADGAVGDYTVCYHGRAGRDHDAERAARG